MDEKGEQLWNQYKVLWDTMQQANSLNYQVLGIVAAATAAILTTGFANIDKLDPDTIAFIFAAVYIVTIPSYRLLQGNRRNIWRISTYLRVFLEPQLDYAKWETHVSIQRHLHGKRRSWWFSSLVTTNEWFIIFLMNSAAAMAIIFLGLGRMQISPTAQIVGIATVIMGNLFLSVITWIQEKNLRRGGKVEDNFYQSWVQVRDGTGADDTIKAG